MNSIEILNTTFLNPIFIYLLPIIIMFFVYLNFLSNKNNSKKIYFFDNIKKSFSTSSYIYYIKNILIISILISFMFILANPNKANVQKEIEKNGIDIVLVLDISKSMEAEDLKPSRIIAAKKVITQYIDKTKTDRVGLVIFAGKPFSSVPLTFDYNILKEVIGGLNTDSLNQNVSGLDGTAIGDAILMASNLMKSEEEIKREKVIILLTDGDANRGVDPILASKAMTKEKIKIYTVGIGSKEGGMISFKTGPFTQRQRIPPLKEDTLREISSITDGNFFRATDNQSLEDIFKEISKLEKTDIKIKVNKVFNTDYTKYIYLILFLLIGLILIEIKNN